MIETDVAGFVAGSGKTGVRGPVVSREGALVEKAFLAGMVPGVGQGVAQAFQPQAVATGQGDGSWPERLGRENAPRQAPETPAPGPRPDRQPGKSKIALPADLGRSLRLLDDAQLDRLTKAVADEIRRRGRNPPDSPSVGGRSAKRTPAKAGRAKPDEPRRAANVTPGQERLILAAFEAGLRPAAIAKEVRVSRSTVQHVTTCPRLLVQLEC